jgi:hypothetical protein
MFKTWKGYKWNWWLYWIQDCTVTGMVLKLLFDTEQLYIIFHCILLHMYSIETSKRSLDKS